MRIDFYIIFAATMYFGWANPILSSEKDIPIIPKPVNIQRMNGSFLLSAATRIMAVGKSEIVHETAEYLSHRIKEQSGISLGVMQVDKSGGYKNALILRINQSDSAITPEGYRLTVSPARIQIEAPSDAGLFYGVQSLLQFCLPSGKSKRIGIPAVKIMDKPRFRWRGMHLDVSRHFFPKEFIKKYIDILALHKMNTFHWHLTDDQGWRIEIKRYPKLTEIGAWRVDREDRLWNDRPPQAPEEKATYGGYYTREEIREIVEYAKKRFITIIPEIEMPAHTTAALAAYPQYSCTGGPFTVLPGGVWPITDIFCAGNDSTFMFLENILDEVISLFPGQYIHIGGDEADKTEWTKCQKCQARIRDNHMKNEAELQSYFIKRIALYLHSRGKRLIGWDEILEGGLAEDAAVMSWRGINGGIAAAQQGHDVVMTPGSHCYFDYYQGLREFEPLAIGGFTPISKVYTYEPVPDTLTPEEAKHILGAQANVWTEYISTPEHAEYMVLPRIAAMAEVVWSPADLRDWNDFESRIEQMLKLYRINKFNYAKSGYLVSISTVMDSLKRKAMISLTTEISTPVIRYSLDGSDPTIKSQKYKKPFAINKSGVIRAAAYQGNKNLAPVAEQRIFLHKAFYSPVSLKFQYRKYAGGGDFGLTNGLQGSLSYDDGKWQGFEFDDLDAVVDLDTLQSISRIKVSFLQNTNSWIFFPTQIRFAVSEDGENYYTKGEYEIPLTSGHMDVSISEITLELSRTLARYVRVYAKNAGICPDWHIGKGGKAWVFVDEIIVE